MALATPLMRATRRAVCPICGHPDYCSFAPDGTVALCYRDVPPPMGWKILKTGLSATGQFRVCVPDTPRNTCRPQAQAVPPSASVASARAALTIRHAVYSALWKHLAVSAVHVQQLGQRGLSSEEVRAYRSWPADHRYQQQVLDTLWDQFGEVLWTIPGFYRHRSGAPRSTALPGLLIPVFDSQGLIQAVKCRPDTPWRGLKYYWLSSGAHGGPSSGAPVGFPPGFAQAPLTLDVVRITEGELKAHVAQILSGIRTVAAPGVGGGLAAFYALQNWWDRANIPVNRRELLVAFDQDVPPNPHVNQARGHLVHVALRAGIRTWLEEWDATAGKGVDDVLRNAPLNLRRVLQ
ncbi:MAG: DUF3854 domain-containing protein [Sulfobacillus thermotolerans]|nr:DUF3854 domain-containing protein [Sulfobacillus thermotolerans]